MTNSGREAKRRNTPRPTASSLEILQAVLGGADHGGAKCQQSSRRVVVLACLLRGSPSRLRALGHPARWQRQMAAGPAGRGLLMCFSTQPASGPCSEPVVTDVGGARGAAPWVLRPCRQNSGQAAMAAQKQEVERQRLRRAEAWCLRQVQTPHTC